MTDQEKQVSQTPTAELLTKLRDARKKFATDRVLFGAKAGDVSACEVLYAELKRRGVCA